MSTGTELREMIDQSFGDGPEHRDLNEILHAGHTAVRRRRVAGSAGAAATVVAAAVLAAGLVDLRQRDESLQPPSTDQATQTPDGEKSPTQARDELEVTATGGGQVTIRNGVAGTTVGPLFKGNATAWVYDIEPDSGARTYALVKGRSVRLVPAAQTGKSLPAWALSMGWSTEEPAGSGDPQPTAPTSPLVDIEENGGFVAKPGVTIVAQRQDLGFPDNFAPDSRTTVGALVDRDGIRYYVLYRVLGGDGEFLTVPAADYPATTLPAFLDFARGKYESGEGLL